MVHSDGERRRGAAAGVSSGLVSAAEHGERKRRGGSDEMQTPPRVLSAPWREAGRHAAAWRSPVCSVFLPSGRERRKEIKQNLDNPLRKKTIAERSFSHGNCKETRDFWAFLKREKFGKNSF